MTSEFKGTSVWTTRGIEADVPPDGQVLGLGLISWTPLGAGVPTGRYGREKLDQTGSAGSLPDRPGTTPAGGSDGRLDSTLVSVGHTQTEPALGRVRKATQQGQFLLRRLAAAASA